MDSDRKISLAKIITSFSTLAVVLPLVTITWAGAIAQPLVRSTQRDTESARSRNLKIIASIKKGETRQSLIVEISLKNISNKEISFRNTDVLIDYSFMVKDREGSVLRPSEVGRRKILESGLVSHKPAMVLSPGKQVMKQLVITEIYDFRPREVYTITVHRRISLDKGKTFEEVTSNALRAKVEGE
jgi:hypothetical protein